MSADDNASPRPWRAAKKCEGTAYIADANGVHVCDATPANAALIEHAVELYEISKNCGTYLDACLMFFRERCLVFDPGDDWIPLEFVLWLFGHDYKEWIQERRRVMPKEKGGET